MGSTFSLEGNNHGLLTAAKMGDIRSCGDKTFRRLSQEIRFYRNAMAAALDNAELVIVLLGRRRAPS
jgi:hypothetical protein